MTTKSPQDALQDLVRMSEDMGLYEVEFAKHKESNMKELTDEQIYKIWYQTRGLGTIAFCGDFARAAIAADRALNAADRKLELLQQAHDRSHAEVLRLAEKLRQYESGNGMHLNAAPADRDVMQLPTYEVRSGSVNGRLAKQPYSQGDALPAIGSFCLVSGANCDIESDQHRAFYWKKVVGYADGFVCLQVDGCWPTVERLTNCWFAEIPNPAKAAAPTPPAEQQGEQEPAAWMTPGGDVTRSKVFADEQSALSFGQQRPTPLYTQPSPFLAELRAKVQALPTYENEWTQGYRDAVLAEIGKLGGKV